MTDITELTGAPKHENQHRISRIIVESPNDELRQMTVEVEQYTDQLIEALEKAQQRITQLESRTVKLPQRYDLIGETDGNCSLNDAEMAPDNDGVYLRVRDLSSWF